MISVEEAVKLGAHPSPTVVLSLGKAFGVPRDAHGANVRSMFRPHNQGMTVLCCQGVVTREPYVHGQELVFVESVAPILGFYNNGFDEDNQPILVAAYGKLEPVNAWRVTVGTSVGAAVMTSVFHYNDLILHVVSTYDFKKPSPVEKR